MMEVSSETKTLLKRLLFKYGIVLVIFHLISRSTVGFTAPWLIELVYPDELPMEFARTHALFISIATLLVNLIVAAVSLSDTKGSPFRWLVFFLCLLLPDVGVVFLLISRLVDDPS